MVNEKVRLINANAIPYEIRYVQSLTTWGFEHGEFVEKLAIEQMPTIDAVEVVHGRWARKQIGKYTGTDEVVCSCCGCFLAVVGSDTGFKEATRDMNYCPNCGAKMDLEESNNDD